MDANFLRAAQRPHGAALGCDALVIARLTAPLVLARVAVAAVGGRRGDALAVRGRAQAVCRTEERVGAIRVGLGDALAGVDRTSAVQSAHRAASAIARPAYAALPVDGAATSALAAHDRAPAVAVLGCCASAVRQVAKPPAFARPAGGTVLPSGWGADPVDQPAVTDGRAVLRCVAVFRATPAAGPIDALAPAVLEAIGHVAARQTRLRAALASSGKTAEVPQAAFAERTVPIMA